MNPRAKHFVLLDRDGTLNEEKEYLSDPAQLVLIAGAGQALRRLQDAGLGIIVITNQSGIAREFFNMTDLDGIHARLNHLLSAFGVRLDGIYHCPHSPDDGCDCRKPLPGLVYQAVNKHGFLPEEAWVIGDKESDVLVGHAVRAKTILVRTGYGKAFETITRADFVVNDLAEAVDVVLRFYQLNN
jgi:D-glycero-D-manno-heptose 1,7-bisphosphate phosphatase